jgi:hypothetical protein
MKKVPVQHLEENKIEMNFALNLHLNNQTRIENIIIKNWKQQKQQEEESRIYLKREKGL